MEYKEIGVSLNAGLRKENIHMTILKWFCFILVCTDTVMYVISQIVKNKSNTKMSKIIGNSIGLIIGILARAFVLYGAATCWLFA